MALKMDAKSGQSVPLRLWIQLTFVYLVFPLILLICAGDIRWWQAWVYSVIVFIAGVLGRFWANWRHPGLQAERLQAWSNIEFKVKPWDKLLTPLMAISISFPLLIVAGLDHRFSWTNPFSPWLPILGLILVGIGYAFAVWAMVENRFFSTLVRIQTDRGHEVCDSGPYRIVRHPGYAGNALALPGIVLALNSDWTLIPAGFAIFIIVIRTALEDRTLQDELPGYREYAQRVRYRLIPGIY